MKYGLFLFLTFMLLLTYGCNKPQQDMVTAKEAATVPVAEEEKKMEPVEQPPLDQADKMIQQFNKTITLTEQQASEIREISDSIENAGLSGAELRQARRDIRTKIRQGVLTEEQRAALQAARNN